MTRISKELRAFFRKIGKRGGKIGGRQRADNLSPERRSEIARMGAAARNGKRHA